MEKIKLSSSNLKGFIYGTLLGDSKIERNGKVFSSKQISKDLIDFKYMILNEHFQNVTYNIIPAYFDGKWNHQTLYEVRVKEEYFKKIFPRFYDDKRKFLTMEQLQALNVLGLAMWYADDGCAALIGAKRNNGRPVNRRIEICTENFTWQECELIQKYFKLFYNWDVRLIRRNSTDRCRIRFTILDGQEFLALISPYFLEYFPSMLYKLDLAYDNKNDNYERLTTINYRNLMERVKIHKDYRPRI